MIRGEMLEHTKAIKQVLKALREGNKIELYLNMLSFVNFSKWHQRFLKELIRILKETITEDYQVNRILLSINPIFFICLSSELLDKVGSNIHIFRHECALIRQRLLVLGKKII